MALPHSLAEERANLLTHARECCSAWSRLSVLLKLAARKRGTLLACSAYGFTLVLMFASVDRVPTPSAEQRARQALAPYTRSQCHLLVDCGTYTALSLAVPESVCGAGACSPGYGCVRVGIAALVRRGGHRPGGPLVYYLALSALVALALPALRGPLGTKGLLLLSIGGIVYALWCAVLPSASLRYHHDDLACLRARRERAALLGRDPFRRPQLAEALLVTSADAEQPLPRRLRKRVAEACVSRCKTWTSAGSGSLARARSGQPRASLAALETLKFDDDQVLLDGVALGARPRPVYALLNNQSM